MNTVRRIAKNSGAAFITRVSDPLISFVFVFFIARYLGVSGLGIYSSAASLLIIFQAFAGLGYEHFITKEVAQDTSKAGKLLVNATVIGCSFAVIVAAGMCASVRLITANDQVVGAVWVLSISLIPYSLGLVCQSINRGFEKLEYITISAVLGNVIKLLFGIIALYGGYGIIGLMAVISGSAFCRAFISLYLALKCISGPLPKFSKPDFVFCSWILKKTPVYAFIFIVATIRMYINIPLLTRLMGEREVGFYDAAYRLVNICSLGIGFYLIAVRPTIFRLYKSSPEKFKFVCTESVRYFFIIILPIIAGITVLGDKFINLIFKAEFLPSVAVLRILIWILILNGFNQILASALISSDNQKANLNANIIGMVCNIALCLTLIPRLSFVGAGIANITATFITFIYQYRVNSKRLFKIGFLHLAKKPLAASVVLGLLIFLLKDMPLFVLIPVSAAAYVILVFAFKVFSLKDVALLRQLWSEKGELTKPVVQV
jgi:O-antigen/teichoic acid export membrane protein